MPVLISAGDFVIVSVGVVMLQPAVLDLLQGKHVSSTVATNTTFFSHTGNFM